MKFWVTIVIFISMLGQIFQGDFIVLDFYTHQSHYAALCINKDKPDMHCNGSCQLDQKMAESHHHDMETPQQVKSVSVVLYFAEDNLHFNWVNLQQFSKSELPSNNFPCLKRTVGKILQPPRLFS